MARHRAPTGRQVLLEFDPETAFEKAVVRLSQASTSPSDSYPALSIGVATLHVLAVATAAMSVLAAGAIAGSGLRAELGFPPAYLSFVIIVLGGLWALGLYALGDLAALKLSTARNTRLMTVILAEMNFADRAADAAAAEKSAPPRPASFSPPAVRDPSVIPF